MAGLSLSSWVFASSKSFSPCLISPRGAFCSAPEASVFAKDSYAAWHQALELEKVRHTLNEERERIERLEDTANEQATLIRSLQYRLSLLQQKLYA